MVEFTQAKSILSPIKKGPDPYFGVTYSMNIYRGCQHQCIYCDSRSLIYRIGDLNKIRVKENSIELLEQELKRTKKKATIGTGSMNDPYMPIEGELKMYQKALELINKYNFPVHIITKSNLVLRDIDLIKSIGKTYSAVSITITTFDDKTSKIIEPGAPPTSERLKVVNALDKMGIYTGVILSPVLPYITDSTDNISRIVNSVAKSGGKYILAWMGLTQREGQREYFYAKLDKHYPGLKEKYNSLFGNNYHCNVPNAENLRKHFYDLCLLNKIETRMEFYKPKNPQQLNLFD